MQNSKKLFDEPPLNNYFENFYRANPSEFLFKFDFFSTCSSIYEHWETFQCIVLDLDVSHHKLCYKLYLLNGKSPNANYNMLISKRYRLVSYLLVTLMKT